ncbi:MULTISPECIES: CHAP domain-containing protein [Flavobacterium]|uniref:CHAP domain-containing protein n=3 Tax=Flavobacterium columnare TaxID=996 RepID=A0AA94F074_9FLAO|nr:MULTISPECIES: CHAP domain-containing protein [Flavobacterium]MCH4829788.1 CHAP domain-containing protein [Flavobacterium columnare]MCH4831587.1 CHAP domain-containing protein [Flavobacterium columnare]MCH4831617.1 CHAP domain-containing protein [Flavobacterium columnare]MCH4832833.1 CHAP domain-containing protein [Flavobacterium columnare]MCH4832871.1 CHAP domain-containing protein [Flavobacterium columnare]
MTLAQLSLEVATRQIGVQEIPKGSNAGPEVEIYLKSVGLGKGYSWCMAFVYYCVLESSKKTGNPNPLKKTAGVLDQWNSKPELRIKTPIPGCIFIMDFGGGQGHTGFVEKVLANGKIQTIEGNTNADGSREGFAVCRRIRSINQIKGFIKL